MEVTQGTGSEAYEEDFIEMDIKEDAIAMTDKDIQLELDVIERWNALNLKNKASKETLSDTPLSTPKIQSVVVVPESTSNRPKVEICKSGPKSRKETKLPKSIKNRSSLAKNKATDSSGLSSPLMALLSKGKTPVRKNVLKPAERLKDNSVVTPVSSKRIRSAGTTPEGDGKQPDKMTANMGIPDFPEKLVALPQETPVIFDPAFVNVRVVTTIPTQKSKEKILETLAQLNKDLNTERWNITNTRRKGSSSLTVYMRIDKRSFDKITDRDDEHSIN